MVPNACQIQLHNAFRYSALVVNKILSLVTCQSSPERMKSGCPHPGAERVSSPESLLGVLTKVRVFEGGSLFSDRVFTADLDIRWFKFAERSFAFWIFASRFEEPYS